MNFSKALEHLKNGEKIKLKSWGDGEYLLITDNDRIKYFPNNLKVSLSNDSILSDDWMIVIDTPKFGDIVKLTNGECGIITKSNRGDYIVLLENGATKSLYGQYAVEKILNNFSDRLNNVLGLIHTCGEVDKRK